MLENHPGYQFLKFMREDDRITWWVGAVARASAELELVLALIHRELATAAEQPVSDEDADEPMGRATKMLLGKMKTLRLTTEWEEFCTRLRAYLEPFEDISRKRNRIIHDSIAREPGRWVAFGSGHVFTGRVPEEISENKLVKFHTELSLLRDQADVLWSEASVISSKLTR